MEQALWLSVLGAALALDHVMVGQWMITQPLVVGAVFGVLLGDLPTGLLIGAMVQLIWIGVLPVGAYVPSDHTITGGITVGLTSMLMHQPGMSLGPSLVLALSVAIPAGFFSGKLDILVRHLNSRIAGMGERAAERYGTRGIDGLNLLGLVAAYFRNFIVYFIWLGPVAVLLRLLLPYLPEPVLRGMNAVFWALPMLSFAVIMEIIAKEKSLWLVLTAFGLAWGLILFGSQYALGIMTLIFTLGAAFVWWKRSW